MVKIVAVNLKTKRKKVQELIGLLIFINIYVVNYHNFRKTYLKINPSWTVRP